jgi:cytochrome c oxidase assembly factor CtaG
MTGALVGVAVVALCLLRFELRWRQQAPMPAWRRRGAWLAALAAAVAFVPPLATQVPAALWAQSLQFSLLAFAVPPLVVLAAGAPNAGAGLAARWLSARGPVVVVAYLLVTVAWRMPGLVDATAHVSGLAVVEAATLVVLSGPFWSALIGPVGQQTPPPRRMALAAVGAWWVWILAFAVGFASHAWYPAFARQQRGQLGVVDSQELGVLIIWLSSGAAFVPVVFTSLVAWLDGEERAGDLERQRWSRVRRPRPAGAVRLSGGSVLGGAGDR